MLGTLPRSAFSVHVGDELYGRPCDKKNFRLHHICVRNFVLCFDMYKPNRLQRYEQQIPTGIQGNIEIDEHIFYIVSWQNI